MAIKLGNTSISEIYLGSQPIKAVYWGNDLVWSKQETPVIEDYINVSPSTEIILEPAAGSYADISVSASSNDWTCNVSGNSVFSVTKRNSTTARVSVNSTNASTSKFGTVTFTCGTASTSVSVRQNYYYVNTGTDTSWYSDGEFGSSHDVTVSSYSTWTATTNDSWISVGSLGSNSCSGGNGSALRIIIDQNDGSPRDGIVTITCGTASCSYSVGQAGAVVITPYIRFEDNNTNAKIVHILSSGITGGTETIVSNVAWTAEGTNLVTSISPTVGSASTTTTVTYSVGENKKTTTATSYIYFKYNDEVLCTLTIKSAGSGGFTPIDPIELV